MKLSMYILEDWLKSYGPKSSISRGNRQIRNVRPFSEDHVPVSGNVYISQLTEDTGGGVMCINDNDIIYLPGADVDDVMNDIMDAFDFYNDWADRINSGRMTLQEVLEACRDVLPMPLIAADQSYYALAFSGIDGEMLKDESLAEMTRNNIVDMDLIKQIEKNPLIRQNVRKAYVQDAEYFNNSPITRNLFSGDRHLGWVLGISKNITRGQCDLLDELGDSIERWVEENADQNAMTDVNSVFAEILKNEVDDKNRIINRLGFAGISNDTVKSLYVTDFGQQVSGYAGLHRLNELADGVYNVIFEDCLVTIVDKADQNRERFEHQAGEFILKAGGSCGASLEFTDIFMMPQMYQLARAVGSLGKKSSDDPIVHFEDAALLYGIEQLKEYSGKWLIHPALGRLKDYDIHNGTDLFNTLRIYLTCERNLADTARALYIHRNSLLYRVSRISEITGIDLDDPDQRLHLLISFKMYV